MDRDGRRLCQLGQVFQGMEKIIPLQLEIISGFSKEFPYLEEKFWGPYSTISARDFARFLTLSQKGKSIDPFRARQGIDKLKAQQEFQLTELERSISFCKKKTLGQT